jgi:DNA-binding response OmpR family regulator
MPGFFGNFKPPPFNRFHAAAHSRPTIENIQRAFELGAADFIEKPFDGREFISRILFHARRERPASNFPDENPNPDTQSLCNTP